MAAREDSAAKPIWLEAALEEYKALRDEVVATLHSQQEILSFGTAAIGILAAGAFNVWEDPAVIALVFLGVTPLLSGIVLVVWVGEFVRRMRAGTHLEELEQAVRNAVPGIPDSVMSWESGLRGGDRWQRHFDWNYAAVVVLFAALGAGSLSIGAYRAFGHWPYAAGVVVVLEAAALVAIIAFVGFQLAAGRRLRRPESELR